MRTLLCGALLMLPAVAAATDGSPRLHLSTGVGAPELLHGELGVFATPKLSVDVRAANAVFNPMLGAGVTYLMGRAPEGDTPRHALMLRMHAMVNPTLGGIRLTSSGDTYGAYVQPSVGYSFLTRRGFSLRASVGVVMAAERVDQELLPSEEVPAPPASAARAVTASRADFALQAGPQATLSLGWAF